jgi:hypothetical protein
MRRARAPVARRLLSGPIDPGLVVTYLPGSVVIHSTDLASFS